MTAAERGRFSDAHARLQAMHHGGANLVGELPRRAPADSVSHVGGADLLRERLSASRRNDWLAAEQSSPSQQASSSKSGATKLWDVKTRQSFIVLTNDTSDIGGATPRPAFINPNVAKNSGPLGRRTEGIHDLQHTSFEALAGAECECQLPRGT